MKLPKLYTERVGLIVFWRGVRLSGVGEPHNLGAVGMISELAAKTAYIRKLKIAANLARKRRLDRGEPGAEESS